MYKTKLRTKDPLANINILLDKGFKLYYGTKKIKEFFRINPNGYIQFSDKYEPNLGFIGHSYLHKEDYYEL